MLGVKHKTTGHRLTFGEPFTRQGSVFISPADPLHLRTRIPHGGYLVNSPRAGMQQGSTSSTGCVGSPIFIFTVGESLHKYRGLRHAVAPQKCSAAHLSLNAECYEAVGPLCGRKIQKAALHTSTTFHPTGIGPLCGRNIQKAARHTSMTFHPTGIGPHRGRKIQKAARHTSTTLHPIGIGPHFSAHSPTQRS